MPIKIIDSKAYMPLEVISRGFDIGASYNDYNAVLTIMSYKNFDDIIGSLSDKEKSWMGIKSDQYIQDFNFLYGEILENYPYTALAERSFGIDIGIEYEKYREKISKCINDVDFINVIKEFIGKFEYMGHISAWGYRYMTELESTKSFVEEFPEYRK